MNPRRVLGCAGLAALAVLAGCDRPKTEEQAAAPAPAKAPAPSTTEEWTAEQLAFLQEKFGELQSTPSGLRYKILAPGEGDATPQRGNRAYVEYRGTFLDGRVFDESKRRGAPFRFSVGLGQVIKGWDETVVTMKKGEKRLVVVPYWLGYGKSFSPSGIPPRTTLVFEMELVNWESVKGIPVSGQ